MRVAGRAGDHSSFAWNAWIVVVVSALNATDRRCTVLPLVALCGSGGLAEVDPSDRSVLARIGLPIHPEGFQLDPDDGRLFVDVPTRARSPWLTSWRLSGSRPGMCPVRARTSR